MIYKLGSSSAPRSLTNFQESAQAKVALSDSALCPEIVGKEGIGLCGDNHTRDRGRGQGRKDS
jgi:hypothetical protein